MVGRILLEKYKYYPLSESREFGKDVCSVTSLSCRLETPCPYGKEFLCIRRSGYE
jgi:hypothetical protein